MTFHEELLIYNLFYDVIEKGSNVILTDDYIKNHLKNIEFRKLYFKLGKEKIRNKIKYLKKKEKHNKNAHLRTSKSSQ